MIFDRNQNSSSKNSRALVYTCIQYHECLKNDLLKDLTRHVYSISMNQFAREDYEDYIADSGHINQRTFVWLADSYCIIYHCVARVKKETFRNYLVYILLATKLLHCGVWTKVKRDKNEIKKWQQIHWKIKKTNKDRHVTHKKYHSIYLCVSGSLLTELKSGRHWVVLSRWRHCWCFFKSWFTFCKCTH